MARAARGANGRKRRLMLTLNSVWALAIWRAESLAVLATSEVNGPMNGRTSATPSTLNAMWATATRLASALAPKEAMSAVAHVPTFAPSTKATAPWRPSRPWWASAMARPMVAADDVTSALNPAATMTASNGFDTSAARTWL